MDTSNSKASTTGTGTGTGTGNGTGNGNGNGTGNGNSAGAPAALTEEELALTSVDELEQLMSPTGGAMILDFWSPTCGPCKAMAGAFAVVAAQHKGDPIAFKKVNTATSPELAAPFHVRAVPTILFVLNGEIVDVVVGAMGATALQDKARWLLSRARGEGFFRRLLGSRVEKKPAV